MKRCADCAVGIDGEWDRCPLCSSPLAGESSADPLPRIPLRISKRRLWRVLIVISITMAAASFAAQLLLHRGDSDIGVIRSVWLGISALWLVAITAILKRRNLAKGVLYLLLLISMVSTYWDYLTGWHGWSLTYTVPIVCAASIAAIQITVRIIGLELGDHILHSGPTILVGLVPVVFLLLGWLTNPWPSLICVGVSLLALALQFLRGPDLGHELAKRLHL